MLLSADVLRMDVSKEEKLMKLLYALCAHCGASLSGQSNSGNGGRYFYYGHCRRETLSGKHKERCVLERIAAVRLEELIVSRLEELVKNPKLLATLVERSREGSFEATKELDQLITAKKQEKVKAVRQLGNLSAVLAEAPEGMQVQSLLSKVNELEILCAQLDEAVAELESQKSGKGGELINSEHVFKIFRAFRKDFSKRPVHEQRDLIRSVVSRVTVSNDGVAHVQYFGSPKPDRLLDNSPKRVEEKLLGTSEKPQNEESPAGHRGASSQRTLVCSVSGMVGVTPLKSNQ